MSENADQPEHEAAGNGAAAEPVVPQTTKGSKGRRGTAPG